MTRTRKAEWPDARAGEIASIGTLHLKEERRGAKHTELVEEQGLEQFRRNAIQDSEILRTKIKAVNGREQTWTNIKSRGSAQCTPEDHPKDIEGGRGNYISKILSGGRARARGVTKTEGYSRF